MKITYNIKSREEQELVTNNITIHLNCNVDYNISINNFGELVLNKSQYGNEDSNITIKPSVANEIRLS